MYKGNYQIRFNDGVLMIIGIPFLSFIIPIVFMGCRFNRAPYFSWDKYLATLVITIIIWIGNRYIMIYSRKTYPEFEDVKKRLVFQSVLMFVFTIVSNMLIGQMAEGIFNKDNVNLSLADIFIYSNSAALFCTIMIIAIYESVFFMHQLKDSIQEAEQLKRDNLSAQLSALKTQVNPHFLFNNLNTLSSIIPEDPKLAVDFVQQLSKLYRHILEVKEEKSILLSDELDVLKAYAFLLKTRFGDNLNINIKVADEKLHKRIVPLSLQIIMENAIKHNIISSERPLHIDVFTENGSLVINNNLQKKKHFGESTGFGIENIKERYQLMGINQVKVIENDSNFSVHIPLLEN